MDFSEKWGRDVDEAVSLALNDLKVPLEEVTVTVLEEPTKGFLGLGSKLAKVRVEKKILQKEEKKEEASVRVEPRKERQPERPAREERTERPLREERPERPAREERTERPVREERERRGPRKEQERYRDGSFRKDREAAPVEEEFPEMELRIREKPEDLEETTDTPALGFLLDMTGKMGLTLDIKAYQNADCLYIDINGKDSGTIIGKRGQTLDAVQYLTSLVVNKGNEKYVRVIVDAENYREKRERTLEQLATRLADKVRRSGKSVRLEPMNPYERKVIHATLQKFPGVHTRSEGEEPYRRVIIEKK